MICISPLPIRTILLTLTALAGLRPFSVQAFTIDGTQQPIAGGYHYEFTIDNTSGPQEVAIITLDAPLGDPLIGGSLTTPAGFLGNYDGGLGLVDFLGDTSLFSAGSITSGFSFDSAGSPPAFFSTFTALDVTGGVLTGTINFTSVPEAGSTFLPACLGLFALAFLQQKRFATC